MRAVVSFAILLVLTGCRGTPDPGAAVRETYDWYVKARRAGVDALAQPDAERYLTPGFIAALRRSEMETNIEPEMLTSAFEVKEMQTNGNRARGRVFLRNRMVGDHFFFVQLQLVNRRWKVDDVKVMEPGEANGN